MEATQIAMETRWFIYIRQEVAEQTAHTQEQDTSNKQRRVSASIILPSKCPQNQSHWESHFLIRPVGSNQARAVNNNKNTHGQDGQQGSFTDLF